MNETKESPTSIWIREKLTWMLLAGFVGAHLLWFGRSLSTTKWTSFLLSAASQEYMNELDSPSTNPVLTSTLVVRSTPVVAYEQEFPFNLTCPNYYRRQLSDGGIARPNVTIAIAYHVGMIRNWKDVVLDQLNTLDQCGLGHIANDMLLSYSGGSVTEVLDLLPPYNFSFQVGATVSPEHPPWEGTIMNAVLDYCQRPDIGDDTVVFYFHDKGVSKHRQDWRENTHKVWTYSRVLWWRKYLEYFTIEQPHLCLNALLNANASACGPNKGSIPQIHYSGNFWTAKCSYINELPRIDPKQKNYVLAEMWIGRNSQKHKLVTFWKRKLETEVGLYKHWIQPDEYRFQPDRLPDPIE